MLSVKNNFGTNNYKPYLLLMTTALIYPKNKLLKKYIQYFFFIENSDPGYLNKHICFPNTNHCLGLFKGNKITVLSDNEYLVEEAEKNHSYLTGIYTRAVSFYVSGVFREVSINFEPLGIEKITGEKISSFSFLNSVIEDVFPKKWEAIYNAAFNNATIERRALALEDFFLKNLIEQKTHGYVPFNEIYRDDVNALKMDFNMSYRSVYRLYKESLDLSPKEFLSIMRLRKAIRSLRQNSKLIDVATEIGFADQSHMIREFKKYTGLTPSQFSNKSTVIDNTLWWSL